MIANERLQRMIADAGLFLKARREAFVQRSYNGRRAHSIGFNYA
jgi:hypothetical protein